MVAGCVNYWLIFKNIILHAYVLHAAETCCGQNGTARRLGCSARPCELGRLHATYFKKCDTVDITVTLGLRDTRAKT